MSKKTEPVVPGAETPAKGKVSAADNGSPPAAASPAPATAGGSANRPLRTFRLKGVKVSVFENRTEQGAFYKTSLQKAYRDGAEWKTTTSLGRDDLPIARLLLGRAWEFILETEAAARSSDQGE